MNAFIRRHLDPASRLGEVLFALIMALGFTASVRLGLDEPDNRTLFVSILGCNLAWAIVDGAMYLLTELFEQGRKVRLIREVRGSRDDETALAWIATELDERLEMLSTEPQRERFYRDVLGVVRTMPETTTRVRREDVRGALAVALLILMATFPVLLPFLFVGDAGLAVRLSNTIAIGMLFLLGMKWASHVGGSPLRIGGALMALGVLLVLITVVLGG